jgi:hypothetical protein
MAGQGHERRFGDIGEESGLPPTPDILQQRSEPPVRHFRTHAVQQTTAHGQPFSSRLSSLKKRQSVPCVMILLGVDLIMPASCSRSE